MTIKKTKPDKVTVTAGATVIVKINGQDHEFYCSGSNYGRELTADQVVKNLKDCIREVSRGKRRKKK